MSPPSIKVVEKKLGRQGNVGQADREETAIEVDPRQDHREKQGGPERMDTIIHEYFHLKFHEWNERFVAARARELRRLLYRDGYRRITPKPKHT